MVFLIGGLKVSKVRVNGNGKDVYNGFILFNCKYFLNNWQDYLNIFTGAVTLRDFVNQFIGQPVLLLGNVKAEGYNIQLAEIVQLSNDTE